MRQLTWGRLAALSTAASALAAVLTLVPSSALGAGLPNQARHAMSVGHADVVHVSSDAGRLVVDVKDDADHGNPVRRKPGDVLIHVKPEAQIELPDTTEYPEYAFLGGSGDPVWLLPELQDENLLWPGWETQDVDAQQFPDAELTWHMLSVRGPGRFSLFTSDSFGAPQVKFDGSKEWPQTSTIINRSHTHATWAFGKEGLYTMRMRVSGRRADGQLVSSDPVEYRIFVGALADLPAGPPAFSLAAVSLAGEYREGDPIELSAAAAPTAAERGLAPGEDESEIRWELRCPNAEPRRLGIGAALRITAAHGDDGCAVAAVLMEYADDSAPSAEALAGVLRVRLPASGGEPQAPLPAQPLVPSVPAVNLPAQGRPSAPAPRVILAEVQVRPATLRTARRLSARCTLEAAGRCELRLHITGAAARKLGVAVSRRTKTVTIARGSVELRAAGTRIVKLTVGPRGRAILRRAGSTLIAQLTTTSSGPGRRWQRTVSDVELGR